MPTYTRPTYTRPGYNAFSTHAGYCQPSSAIDRERFFREEEFKAKLRYQLFLRGIPPSRFPGLALG
jgi:hypothetical protein